MSGRSPSVGPCRSRGTTGPPFRWPGPVLARRSADREEILEAAGFDDVNFSDVREPVYYGPDAGAALDWVRGFTSTSEVLKRLDPASADRAVGRLRATVAAHPATTVSGSTPAPGSSRLSVSGWAIVVQGDVNCVRWIVTVVALDARSELR